MVFAMGCALTALASSGCYRVPAGKAAVASIEIEGVPSQEADAIAERIATRASQRFLFFPSGTFYEYETLDRFALRRDLSRIERHLRARGFYDAQVRAARVVPDGEKVHVTIEVDLGAPVIVGGVVLEGDAKLSPDARDAVRAAANDTLRPGEPFDEDAYEATEKAVVRAMTARGYAKAKLTKRAEVDMVSRRATVILAVEPGQPVKLGKITFVGLDGLPEDAARRVFGAQEGEPYSSDELDTSRTALLDLGVFSSVELEADTSRSEQTGTVPVTVRCTPAKLHALLLGGGLQFDQRATDVHALVGWQSANFLGDLRKLDVRYKPGIVLYPLRVQDLAVPEHPLYQHRVLATLKQPALFERRTTGFVHGEYNVYPVIFSTTKPGDNVPGYHEIRGDIGVQRPFGHVLVTPEYGIQVNEPIDYLGTTNLLSLLISRIDVSAFLDLRDDPVRTTKGIYAGTQLQVAGGPLGGVATDFRVQPDVRAYLPLPKKLVLAFRASAGLLYPSNYGDAAKYRERHPDQPVPNDLDRDAQILFFRGFFSGGPSSNRGYALRTIAPAAVVNRNSPVGQSIAASTCSASETTCQLPFGGRTLWEASTELRIPLGGAFAAATFCDLGDVSPLPTNFRFDYPHLSCGGGARYDTPVGPIRVDIGTRITKKRPAELDQGDIFGAPIAIGIGIGEAF